MKERYDVIVAGAGPAGSWTAKYAAENGASVLLLEKDGEIGVPVRCAEGVAEKSLKDLVDVNPQWIARTITGGRLVAPDGTAVESYPDERGYVLHRKLFDADLAAMAAKAGAEIRTKAYVFGLLFENGRVDGVRLRHLGHDYSIRSSLVIGADGVESRVGRWAGLETCTPHHEMESCVQMTLANIPIDPDVVEFRFGHHVAPGGYLWIFPKGPKSANVGLGISGDKASRKKALYYLREFVERNFPHAGILSMVAGGVPAGQSLKSLVADGIMLVGDAARQTNPLTGGGIINAMIAGRIAGRVAAEAVKDGDVSAARLTPYEKEWIKAEGRNNDLSYKIKRVVYRFSDHELNEIARMLLKLPPRKRTAFNIFKTALFRHPKLVLDAARVFVS
ncbi:NAD(P)/FAD-dependent oxidoreductase [bacterium]|nr:NAD(P)/FAD-dependent oxidoreductase [bacterium]